jgi:hypothetical protein
MDELETQSAQQSSLSSSSDLLDAALASSPTSVKLQCCIDVAGTADTERLSLKDKRRRIEPPSTKKSSSMRSTTSSVTFHVDEKNQIKTEQIESQLSLTPEERQNMWWTKKENSRIYEKTKALIIHFRTEQTDYLTDFNQMFKECAGASSKRLRDYGFVDLHGRREARGLERQIHAILPKYRNKFVEYVLEVQAKIPKEVEPEVKSRMLCAKSLQLSRPSRALARINAYHDLNEVLKMIKDELKNSASTL